MPLVISRLRQLNMLLQTVAGIIISLGRQNPIITKHVPSILVTQEATLVALFQAYCLGGENIATGTLQSWIWEIVTLVDNIKDLLGQTQVFLETPSKSAFTIAGSNFNLEPCSEWGRSKSLMRPTVFVGTCNTGRRNILAYGVRQYMRAGGRREK